MAVFVSTMPPLRVRVHVLTILVISMLMLQDAGAKTSGSRGGGAYRSGGSSYRSTGGTYGPGSYSSSTYRAPAYPGSYRNGDNSAPSSGTYTSNGRCNGGSSSGSNGGDLGNTTNDDTKDSGSADSSADSSQNDDLDVSSPWMNSPKGKKAFDIFCFLIGNGLDYRAVYSNITSGSFCVNNHIINGYEIGCFQCPVDGFERSDLSCCGPYPFEYCCESSSGGLVLAIVIPLAVVLTVTVIVIYCCKRHGIAKLRGFWQFSRPAPLASRQVFCTISSSNTPSVPLALPAERMVQQSPCSPMGPYTIGGNGPPVSPVSTLKYPVPPGFPSHSDGFHSTPSYPYNYPPQPPPPPPEHSFYSPSFPTYPAPPDTPSSPPPPPTYDQVMHSPYTPMQNS